MVYLMQSGCGDCTMTKEYVKDFVKATGKSVLMRYIVPAHNEKILPCSNCKSVDDRCNDCIAYNNGVKHYLELIKVVGHGTFPAIYDFEQHKVKVGKDNIRELLEYYSKEDLRAGKYTLPK